MFLIKEGPKYGQEFFEETLTALLKGTKVFILCPARKKGNGFASIMSVILTMDVNEAREKEKQGVGYKILTVQEVLDCQEDGINKPLFTSRLAKEILNTF